MILRENTEGLYASRGAGVRVGSSVVTDTLVVTRTGTARICRRAFEPDLGGRASTAAVGDAVASAQ